MALDIDAIMHEDYLMEPPSSPPSLTRSTKQRKPPPITPRRFNRFFNPHASRGSSNASTSSRRLGELTLSAVNRLSAAERNQPLEEFDDLPNIRLRKRRRKSTNDGPFDSDAILGRSSPPLHSSPIPSSPCQWTSPRVSRVIQHPVYAQSLRQIRRSCTSHLLAPDYKSQTVDFCSTPVDVHQYSPPALPFCTASCNTNSLVAIGDEEGGIRIIESARDGKPAFGTSYLSFKPHNNAVIHLAFSSDDRWLATASGDQTAKIIDMPTQTPTFVLAEHTSSLKQVIFQPGEDNVIATCSRDGIVALWDLRCNNQSAALRMPSQDRTDDTVIKYASKIQSISNGHSSDSLQLHTTCKRAEPSITALQFLSPSRSHLFLTSSDGSARLRLWDIRGRYSNRRNTPVPISTTGALSSHDAHRQYGISSLAMSTDYSRVYAVCKDSTVYAYSTNHLILGQAPELSSTPPQPWAQQRGGDGLGPLYGLRHPSFRTATFYVRAAVRKASDYHTELLAVGSTEGSPILFPTDERMLKQSGTAASRKREDGVPIYNSGTALVRGHTREVTSLTWTPEGDLVSVSDDYTARCWREDAEGARKLRVGGEGEGRRWMCGWADVDVESGWDDEDG